GCGAERSGPGPADPAPLTAAFSAQETVERLLRLHFRDGRTRVNGDALLLMAELLKVFVRARPPQPRQAQAEDLEKVDIEHVEKVLPQLVSGAASLPSSVAPGPCWGGLPAFGNERSPRSSLSLQLLDF
uniref:Centromere protein X n=1 Tax=Gallus gallus TaxID=9031 RepID=A0A8V1AB38_CHICK